MKNYFKVLSYQIRLFVTEPKNLATYVIASLLLIILASIEGEGRALSTVVTSAILSTSLLRLRGAYEKMDENIVGTHLKKDSNPIIVGLSVATYVTIVALTLVITFIGVSFFFTEVVDIMNGNIIKYGDIWWGNVNWWYVLWGIFLTIMVDIALGFFLYSLAIKTKSFFMILAYTIIIISVIMNVFYSDYLLINEEGIYYTDFKDNWVNYIWFGWPTFWSNSVTLKSFIHYTDNGFIYNPFFVGNYLNKSAKSFQILFIAMPWVNTIFFISLSLGIRRFWKDKIEYTR